MDEDLMAMMRAKLSYARYIECRIRLQEFHHKVLTNQLLTQDDYAQLHHETMRLLETKRI